MREFERQIHKYKQQLPHMWEKVISAGVSLIVAAAMTVSSTFAWVVLSTNPEIKGINTTITANGNLEIALASGDDTTGILLPADSLVGDGGKDLVQKNITWGNLVNLGDPIYGLENLMLRPAALNTNNLLDKPLYAASYGEDGRVETLESDFAYAYWDQDQFSAQGMKYGVRAVSSVTYGPAPGQNLALASAVKTAENAINMVKTDLRKLATDPELNDLVGLMGAYVQAQIDEKLGGGDEPFVYVSVQQLESIFSMMSKLKNNMEMSADALAAAYNVAMQRHSSQEYVAANRFTGTYLLTAAKTDVQNKLKEKNASNVLIVEPAMLNELWTLRTDYQTLVSDMEILETYRGRDDVVYRNLQRNGEMTTYPAIETYVNHIADVATTTINGTAIGKLSASNISSLTGGGTKPIMINKGILQRMDQFTGAKIQSNNLSVTIKVFGMGSTATGKATTSAKEPYVLDAEQTKALSGDTSYENTNRIAGDTFGMALDFFLRTNATNAKLILQGSPVYEERDEVVSATINGVTETLYIVTVNNENKVVYLKEGTNGEEDVYYEYDRESKAVGAAVGTTTDIPNATVLTEKVKYVVGYNGVNRVWGETENPALLDGDSTTQGMGSCYTFYANNPDDQVKATQLLEHFRVAFIDGEGHLLGKAQLDTKNKVEQYGKVVVPLVLDIDNDYIIDETGERLYTLTDLECNTPTLITALVYLDGENLTNDQVLAAGEIQGQLNIQFGTTADMNALDDPILMGSKCHVTATMAGDTSVTFDSTDAQRTKTVTVQVEGYEPTRVEAYFLREINSMQGIRQQKMTFTQNGDGDWVASHTFTAPGKYVLREVYLDGVSYDLKQATPIVFTVEGFGIASIHSDDNGRTYMTTEKSFDTSVSLTFASSNANQMPTSVKGAFIHKETGNRTTVYFTRSVGATWNGSASFTTSGVYRLEYLELNDQYTGLPEESIISMDLYLGLTASVYTGENNFALEEGESRDVDMSLIIRADNGEVIGDLGGVWLQYTNNGSGVTERGLGASMVWNSNRQHYEGTFHVTDAGIYNYEYVSIRTQDGTTSYLGQAVTSPTITAISSNPPRYVSKDGFGEVFALNNSAKFTVRMKNADSATVDAVLKNEEGDTYYVRGVSDNQGSEQAFVFTVPIIDGVQSGNWTLQNLYMTNVYGGENNILYDGSIENGPDVETEGKPLYTVSGNYYLRWLEWSIADLTNEGESTDVEIRLVSNVNVLLTDSALNASKDFGKTAGQVTASFGTVHTLGNLELEVSAGNEHRPLSDFDVSVSAVELTYNFDQTSVNKTSSLVTNPYGNYTMAPADWANLSENPERTRYVFNEIVSVDGVKHVISTKAERKQISIAGRYKATGQLVVTLTDAQGGTATVAVDATALNTPVYTVSSKGMSVEIESISPSGVNQSVSKDEETTENKNSYINDTKDYAEVYCQGYNSNRDITIEVKPHVTLKITGNENAPSVTMPFAKSAGNNAPSTMHKEGTSTENSNYVWENGAASATMWFGNYTGGVCGGIGVATDGAGQWESSSLTIVLDGYTYGMTVKKITINNPHW